MGCAMRHPQDRILIMKLMVILPLTLATAVTLQAQSYNSVPGPSTGMTNSEEGMTNLVAETNAMTSMPAKPTKSMSLTDCVQEVLQYNLGLQIARISPQVALFDLRADYGVYDPTFSASAGYSYTKTRGNLDTNGVRSVSDVFETETVSSGVGGYLPWGMTYDLSGTMTEGYGEQSGLYGVGTDGNVKATLTQPLLQGAWVDSSRLLIATAKRTLKQSDLDLRLAMMDAITLVEKAYYNLIAAQENVRVQEKGLELANRLLAENKKRVEVGAMAPLDEKQAESQVATARADLLTARQNLAVQQNALKTLLTDDYRKFYDTDVQPAESLAAPVQTFNVQDSWAKGINQRPDLLKAKLEAEKQGLRLKYYRNQLFPILDVSGSYGYTAGGDNTTVTYNDGFSGIRRRDQPFYSAGVTFSIPLSYQGPRNAYKSTKKTMEQRLLEVKQTEQAVLTEIDNAIVGAKAAYERVDATREARIYAEAALDAEQKKLESGKSTSFVVLQLQKDLTSARSAEIGALADYNNALAELALAEGSTLQRRNVEVRIK